MTFLRADFGSIDDYFDGADGVESALHQAFERFSDSPTASQPPILGTIQGLLAGISADYDGATDRKRRGQIFIIGHSLAILDSEIRFCVSFSATCQYLATR